jgi:predicted transcriptional regulator
MYVILTTPNGWEGAQQNRMRQAAIKAGLVDQEGGRRVKFVTEAEVGSSIIRIARDSPGL